MITNELGHGYCPRCCQFKPLDRLVFSGKYYKNYCKDCNNAAIKELRRKKRAAEGKPINSERGIVDANRQRLMQLEPGIYTMENLAPKSGPPGFLALREDRVQINLWGRDYFFMKDVAGIALFLANRGIRMTDREAILKGEDGHRIRLMDLPQDREALELRAFLLP